MKLTLPAKVRRSLYALTALGTPVVAYLQVKGIIGDAETVLWAAEVTVVSALAGFNTTED
ncbi:hypothetical protein [Pimelobacter simplex]|uniref:hypothetical protein n=1 Tax=Nocardioides simplex TaxID=2045 RepID=UPI003AAA4879